MSKKSPFNFENAQHLKDELEKFIKAYPQKIEKEKRRLAGQAEELLKKYEQLNQEIELARQLLRDIELEDSDT